MNQITITMNQTLTLLSLYSEFIACLVAASVLGLFTGWMSHRSSANKRLNASTKSWEGKLARIEAAAVADTDNLEEQLQDLALELKNLKATNKVLTESLKKNDTTIQKARAEAIELNRQNSESQERLQRVIQQKEREIAGRANGINYETDETMALQGSLYDPQKSASIISSALKLTKLKEYYEALLTLEWWGRKLLQQMKCLTRCRTPLTTS